MISITDRARKRMDSRPDIYDRPIVKKSNKEGYPEYVSAMILDLSEHIEDIGKKAIAKLLGVGTGTVQKALAGVVHEADELSDDEIVQAVSAICLNKTNEEMCADALAALRCTGRDGYSDHPDAATEYVGGPVVMFEPRFRDVVRKADQSHTLPRPITLPTFPILPLRNRYAA